MADSKIFGTGSIGPKKSLLNPELVRPDWQTINPRPTDLLWLDKNENLDPQLFEFNKKIWSEMDPIALSTYPECASLYKKLANWLNLAPENLILTPGSDGAIRMVFEAFVNEGDLVVHTSPTFAMYPVYSQIFGARVNPLVYENSIDGPRLTANQIISHLKHNKPKLFCLPNPDSPTGNVILPNDLRKIIELCASQDTVVLIDEAYHPFYDWTCVQWISEFQNLVVARTFAKAWGLAGLRIGYAVGHSELIKYLHKLRPMYEVSTVSIAMMEKMLDYSENMRLSVNRINDGKNYFANEMTKLGLKVLYTHGNFLHVNFGKYAHTVHQSLRGKVLYRLDFKDLCLSGYSRFSCTTVDAFRPIVEIIRATINKQAS